MRNFNYILISLTAIVAVMTTSCQKQETPINGEDNTMTISAEAPSGTKTSIDGLDFTWVSGDALGVYAQSVAAGASERFSTQTSDSKEASFTGVPINITSPEYIYAVYPYDGNKTFTNSGSQAEYTFTLPTIQTQQYTGGTINHTSIGDYAFMYGRSVATVSANVAEIPAISMKHLMSIFDFNLTNVGGKKIHSLTIRAKDDNMFVTSVEANFDTDVVTPGTANGGQISVNLSNDGVSGIAGTAVTVRLAMFPHALASAKTWTIELGVSDAAGTSATEIKSYEKVFGTANTSVAGSRYTVALDYSDFTISTPIPANCYMVAPGGSATLNIPAVSRINQFWKYGGNGEADGTQSTLYPYGFNNHANKIGDADQWYAEVIWADFDYNGKIDFTQKQGTPGTGNIPLAITLTGATEQGNIIIGVKKQGGDYLWSWHIWITDFTGAAGETFQTPSGVLTKTVMDRNLGAKAAKVTAGDSKTYGFSYQWGRKDPFPMSPNIDADSSTEPSIFTGALGSVTSALYAGATAYTSSLVHSINNPMSFRGSSGFATDWISAGTPGSNAMDLWNYRAESANTTEPGQYIIKGTKSIFDPCPPGWRMPWQVNWSGLTTTELSSSMTSFSVVGMKYGNFEFPAAGRREDGGALTNSSKMGYFWSGSPNSTTTGQGLFINPSGPFVNSSFSYELYRSLGCSVRPVKE